MNNITDFYIAFNTVGLLELQQGMDKLQKQMDGLETGFEGASKGSNKTSGSLMGFLGKLGLVTSAVGVAAAAVKNAFSVADRAIELRNMADAADVAASKIEALGIVLRKYGGDEKTAGAMYKNFRDLIKEYNQGKIPQNQREVMARYGFSVRPGMTPEQVQNTLAQAMHTRALVGDIGGRNQIAEAFGLDKSAMLALSNGVQWLSSEINEANKHLVLSNDQTVKDSEELKQTMRDMKQTWDKVSAELIPVLNDLLQALAPLVEFLAPIAAWAARQVGGTVGAIGDTLRLLRGQISWDEYKDRLRENNNVLIKGGMAFRDYVIEGESKKPFNQSSLGKLVESTFGDMSLAANELQMTEVPPILYTDGRGNPITNNTTNYGNTVVIELNGQEAGRVLPDGTFQGTSPAINARGAL